MQLMAMVLDLFNGYYIGLKLNYFPTNLTRRMVYREFFCKKIRFFLNTRWFVNDLIPVMKELSSRFCSRSAGAKSERQRKQLMYVPVKGQLDILPAFLQKKIDNTTSQQETKISCYFN